MIITLRQAWRILRFPIAVFALNLLVQFPYNFYDRWPWIDIPLHIMGGASIGIAAAHLFRLLQDNKQLGAMRPWVQFFLTVAAVAAVAVLWEDYEFLTDHFLGTHAQLGNTDTMKDMFDGMLGGSVAALAAALKKSRR